MDFLESEEHAMVRDSVRRIAQELGGHEYYAKKSRAGERLSEAWQNLAAAGFIGVNWPEQYGGSGMGLLELAIVCEEMGAAGCPTLLLVVTPAICGSVILRYGSEAQKRRWLPRFASGETKMAFAITEPDAGSNSHKISTTATKSGDGWRLSGSKVFISGVDEAESVLVVAKTGTRPDGRSLLTLFAVDTSARGFTKTLIPIEAVAPDKQYMLFFDEVPVSDEDRIGPEGRGLEAVFSGLNPERVTAAALANGVARYALEKASRYANERKVFDAPIGTHQGVAHPLAKAKIELELARLMTTKAAWLYDRDSPLAGEAANIAKYAAAEAGIAAVDQAIQTHGGNGFTLEYGLADLYWVARLLRTAPVSREMILNFVAQHSLGLPRSY